MNKFIKQLGVGVSAAVISFATVAATPIASSTYAEDTEPYCATIHGTYKDCIMSQGASNPDGSQSGRYTVRKNGYTGIQWPLISEEAKDYISYKISDTSVANIVQDKEMKSGEYTFKATVLEAYKVGKTELIYTLNSNKEELLRVPIEVYELSYPENMAIAVGKSKTFNITTGPDVELTKVELNSFFNKWATFKSNGNNTYTMTVNSMPYGLPGMGAEKEEPLYTVNFIIDAKNKTTGVAYNTEYVPMTVYEQAIEDKASESVSNSTVEAANEAKLADISDEVVGTLMSGDVKDGETVNLSSGAKIAVSDVEGFKDAIKSGTAIEIALTKPEEIKEVSKDVAAKMESKLPESAKGARYVDINVLISAAGKSFGKLVETNEPLTVSLDVTSDPAAQKGFRRSYYVVRLHDGVAERIDASYDDETKKVSFSSDKFSTYLVAYEDTIVVGSPDSGFNTRSTEGLTTNYTILATIATALIAVGAFMIAKKHESR